MADWRAADLEPIEMAMLEFVEKVTLNPGAMTADDVVSLRATGLGDENILEISLICAYYNMINRIAESLGADY